MLNLKLIISLSGIHNNNFLNAWSINSENILCFLTINYNKFNVPLNIVCPTIPAAAPQLIWAFLEKGQHWLQVTNISTPNLSFLSYFKVQQFCQN